MAKTIRNKFYKYLTYENLMNAHLLSKRCKGYRKEIILFNLKQEEYLMYLYDALYNKKYKHGKYISFYVYEPKLRKIEKARYLDRIVNRWFVDSFIKPLYVPMFINNTYACIEKRGMHKACLDMQNMMKHCKRIWNNYYILKMDVRKFFYNIDKDILISILERKIKDEDVMWLVKEILFANSRKVGIEIGNYSSQMFGNIYLNELDQYAKNKLHIKYYSRYMDDVVLLVKTKEEAILCLDKIKLFLNNNLKLELNEKTQIIKSSQGVNFCGYKINEYRLKIRDIGKRKLKKKVKQLKYKIRIRELSSKDAKKYLCGHLGYIKIANTFNLENNIFYRDKL